MTRAEEKMAVFIRLAVDLAKLSRCKRLSVGCVIIPPDFSEVLAIGYNGPPAGVDNCRCRGNEGTCGCSHSEANALVKLSTSRSGLTLVSTVSPCEQCAGLILNCGRVSTVVYVEQYRTNVGNLLLEEGGIVTNKWPY